MNIVGKCLVGPGYIAIILFFLVEVAVEGFMRIITKD